MAQRRQRGRIAALWCLLIALAARGVQGQVLSEVANASSLPDFWLPCGKTTRCDDPKACCAIWGVCGYSDRYCGQYCLNGACSGRTAPPPPPQGGSNLRPPPSPAVVPEEQPPLVDPTKFDDQVISVREGEVALAGCNQAGWIITAVENVMYGDVATRCNSTLSFTIVSAACKWQSACIVPAVNPVFDDPCPSVYKTLQFGYRCQPELLSAPPPPGGKGSTGSGSPPPPSRSPPPSPRPPSPRPPSPRPPSPRPPSPRPPSPRPPRPRPPPPSPRPPSPPPNLPVVPSNALLSPLWGQFGEMFTPRSMLSDWSQAGYAANLESIPDFPVKYNVMNYGARGDGNADDTKAFLDAISAASSEAKRTGQGVAVLAPRGRYRITAKLVIRQSNVVLRGEGVGATTLYFPRSLASVYGTGTTWAFGGTWLTILGKNSDSKDTGNYRTDVTANVAQGDKRVQVASTAGLQVGQWLRIFVLTPNNRSRRRQLLTTGSGAATARRRLRQATPAPAPGPSATPLSLVERLFDDPELQKALNASFAAEIKLDAAIQANLDNPDRVPAQWAEPNATNPLGMDPWLLAAARFAATAMRADSEDSEDRVPALALDGTLDAYLYGENIVDSGDDSGIYPKDDHIRFISRVAALGPNWIEFERAVPYDVRLKWKPVIHVSAATVQNSGFEGFTVEFPWTAYPEHLDVKGMNALGIYGGQNCWMRNLKVINGDNAYIVNGADFVTVTNVETDFTKARGTTAQIGNRNGHHALWLQQSSNVLMTNFTISKYRWYHDLSLAIFSELSVYSNGKGLDINIDSHRGGTHNNLLSNIDVGLGTRTFLSGGAKYRGAQSGANVTWWNVRKADGSPIRLPPCDFGPLLLFVGNWLSPVSASSAAANAESIDLPLASAQQVGAPALPELAPGSAPGPAPAPAPAPASDSVSAASTLVDPFDLPTPPAAPAPTPANATGPPGSQDSKASGLAVGTGWCTRQKWRVELVGNGFQLWPADLAAAQVAARQRGTL